MMKLSIIIVNYKAWKPLQRCLDALISMVNIDFSWEVIVVDNHSNDGIFKEFQKAYPKFNFIENEGNYGFAHANNLGVKSASGEYVMFLNSDTIPNEETLGSLIHLADQYNRISIISAQQADLTGKNEDPFDVFPSLWTINGLVKSIYLMISKKKRSWNCNSKNLIFPDWVSGSLILMKRTYFDQVGGWDEDYWLYSEDIDLCKRLTEDGGVIVLQCKPSIIHQHGGTTRRNIRVTAFSKSQVIISKHIYFRKHFMGFYHFLLQFFLVINTLLFSYLLQAIGGLIFFFIGSLRKYPLIYFYLLTYYVRALKRNSWLIDSRNMSLPD